MLAIYTKKVPKFLPKLTTHFKAYKFNPKYHWKMVAHEEHPLFAESHFACQVLSFFGGLPSQTWRIYKAEDL